MSNTRDPQLDALLQAASRPRPELDALAEVASGLGYVRAERFAERVYESLFYAIATGKIAPGSKLPAELELAALFDVSRPVVRQALDRLREDQLVDSRRGSGTYVRAKPDLMGGMPAVDPARRVGHILEGLELRMVIEPECAYFAALRRSAICRKWTACWPATRMRTRPATSPTTTTSAFIAPSPPPPATSASCRCSSRWSTTSATRQRDAAAGPYRTLEAHPRRHRRTPPDLPLDPRAGRRGRAQHHALAHREGPQPDAQQRAGTVASPRRTVLRKNCADSHALKRL